MEKCLQDVLDAVFPSSFPGFQLFEIIHRSFSYLSIHLYRIFQSKSLFVEAFPIKIRIHKRFCSIKTSIFR